MSAIDWVDISSKIGVGLVTAVVTGLIVANRTAQYALNRFYKEKWWEKRLSAFLEVTEHAYKVKRADDYWLAAIESSRAEDNTFKALSDADQAKLKEEHDSAIDEIIRISHLASLTLSPNASTLLATFISEHNAIYPSWWVDEISSDEATERSSEIINILFKGLLAEAKQALNLPENDKYI